MEGRVRRGGLEMSLMLARQRAAKAGNGEGETVVSPSVIASGKAGLLAANQTAALVSASLAEDLEALHSIASFERKAVFKRDTLLPKYAEYINRFRDSGQTHDLLGYALVWLFDCGFIERALDLAGWCMEHGQRLPDRFKSSVPLLVALRTLEWAKAEHDAGRSPEPFFGQVFDRLFDPDPELVWDVPDQLAANYLKLRGLALAKSGDVSGAVAVLRQAQEKGAKVKAVRYDLLKKVP